MDTVEKTLPSGKKIVITLADFDLGKDLYQTFCEELSGIQVAEDMEVNFQLMKNIICTGLASKKLDKAIVACFHSVTYDGLRILNVKDTFATAEARGDYLMVCLEVAKANIAPFVKSLYAQFVPLMEALKKVTQA